MRERDRMRQVAIGDLPLATEGSALNRLREVNRPRAYHHGWDVKPRRCALIRVVPDTHKLHQNKKSRGASSIRVDLSTGNVLLAVIARAFRSAPANMKVREDARGMKSMQTQLETLARELKLRMVELANANNDQMSGSMEDIWQIIDQKEVVFALWQDAKEPDGVGMLIVKGATRVRQIAEGAAAAECAVSAIKCLDAEQAAALAQLSATRHVERPAH